MPIIKNDLANGGSSFTVELRHTGIEAFRETYPTEAEASSIHAFMQPKMKAAAKAARAAAKAARGALGAPNHRLSPMAAFMQRKVIDVAKEYIKRKKAKSLLKRNGKQGEGWDSHVNTLETMVGESTIGDIVPTWSDDYVARMRTTDSMRNEPFSFATIEKHFKLIKAAVCNEAWMKNLTPPKLPFDTTKLFPKNWRKDRTRTLRPEEEAALREVISKFQSPTRPQWDPLLTMALETGARLQELVLTRWDEFDLDRRVWFISEDLVKTGMPREVPLSNKAIAALQTLLAMKDPNSSRVFHLLGTPEDVSRQFRRCIAPKAKVANYCFHDNRHSATTRLRSKKNSKLDSAQVARMMGHSQAVMNKTYDHTPAADLVDLLPS
jgi:integrase